MKHLTKLKYFSILLSFAPIIFGAIPTILTPEQRSVLLANPIKPPPPTQPYSARVESRVMYGNERSFIRPMFLLPLIQSSNKITFANLIIMGDTKKNIEANIGFGARWLKKTSIIGGFIHYDLRQTKNKKQVYQATIGLEFFKKYLEYRLNIYIPLQNKTFVKQVTVVGGNYDSGSAITTYTTHKNDIFEVTRKGFDVEVGGQIPQHTPFAAFARVFYFHHDKFEKIYGIQIRTNYQIREWLELRTSYIANNIKNQKNHYFIGFNFIWQSNKNKYKEILGPLSRKMVKMPIRDLDVVTTEEYERNKDLQTLARAGRGIIVPGPNVEVDPGSNIAFPSISEANKTLNITGDKIAHVGTGRENGDIFVTAQKNDPSGMSLEQMEDIGLGGLDKNVLELSSVPGVTTLGEITATKFDDQRQPIVDIRNQGVVEDKLNKEKKEKESNIKAEIENLEDLIDKNNIDNDELEAQKQQLEQDKLQLQQEIAALNQQKNDAQDATANSVYLQTHGAALIQQNRIINSNQNTVNYFNNDVGLGPLNLSNNGLAVPPNP